MSRGANLSALGLYNWDNTLFDLLTIPEQLDKDVLIKNLLAETAELEILYPNPAVLRSLLGVWSAKRLEVWNQLFATTQYEYNPIENYNRYETGSENGAGNVTHSGTDQTTDTTTHTGSDTRARDTTEGGSDTVSGTSALKHKIAGFDSLAAGASDGLVDQTADDNTANTETEYGHTEDQNEKVTYNNTLQKTGSLSHGEHVSETKHGDRTLHAHGNIGVMSTQQMIDEQRNIVNFSLYDIIIDEFKQRFCILVY